MLCCDKTSAVKRQHFPNPLRVSQRTENREEQVPAAYWFSCSRRDITGGFTLLHDTTFNSQSAWESDVGQILYFTGAHWAIAGSEQQALSGGDVGVRGDAGMLLGTAASAPHKVLSWTIDDQQERFAEATPETNDRSNVQDLMKCMRDTYCMRRGYRHLPYYMVFLIVLLLHYAFSEELSRRAWNAQSATQLLSLDKLKDINSEADMWKWMQGDVQRLWSLPIEVSQDPYVRKVQMRLTGGVMIHQYRSHATGCSSLDRLVFGYNDSSDSSCAANLGTPSREPFGTGKMYNYDAQSPDPEYAKGLQRENLYLELDAVKRPRTTRGSFMVLLGGNETAGSIMESLQSLERTMFVDSFTRLITFDVMFESPVADLPDVVGVQVHIEFLVGGHVSAGFAVSTESYKSKPADLLLWWMWCFSFVIFTLSFVQNIRAKTRMWHAGKNVMLQVFEFWDLYDISFLVVLMAGLIQLWGARNKFPGCTNDIYVCFTWFNMLKHELELRTAYAWLLILSMGRLLKYVRFNTYFNTLSETIRLSAHGLLSLGATFFLIHIAFSMGGHILFGAELLDFRTTWQASGFLTRSLTGGTLPNWHVMHASRAAVAAAYFVSYFVVVWLLVLNMVLAIVTASFSVVDERIRRTNGATPLSLYSAVRGVIAGWAAYCRRRRSFAQGMKIGGRMNILFVIRELVYPLVSCCLPGEDYDPALHQVVCLMRLLREHADATREHALQQNPGTRRPDHPDKTLTVSELQLRGMGYLEATPAIDDFEALHALIQEASADSDEHRTTPPADHGTDDAVSSHIDKALLTLLQRIDTLEERLRAGEDKRDRKSRRTRGEPDQPSL